MKILLLMAAPAALVAAGSPVWVGKFDGSGALPAPWRVVQIDKKTKPTILGLKRAIGGRAESCLKNCVSGEPTAVDQH